jgi:hypothetical protein
MHCGLACVVMLDSVSCSNNCSFRSGNRCMHPIGTGASGMIEPLPLICGESSPEVVASPVAATLRSDAAVVTPMSKGRPFTE